jgi:sugar fermentation stimulation protein A
MVQEKSVWIGVNTSRTNKLVAEALHNGIINDFGKVLTVRPEVKVSDKSRLDFLVETTAGNVYLEVKNCSLAVNRVAMFPDAVTSRGKKHLEELARLQKKKDTRAAVLFCVQRGDADHFSPAREIDPAYATTLQEVHDAGVTVLAYQADVDPKAITVTRRLDCRLNKV